MKEDKNVFCINCKFLKKIKIYLGNSDFRCCHSLNLENTPLKKNGYPINNYFYINKDNNCKWFKPKIWFKVKSFFNGKIKIFEKMKNEK